MLSQLEPCKEVPIDRPEPTLELTDPQVREYTRLVLKGRERGAQAKAGTRVRPYEMPDPFNVIRLDPRGLADEELDDFEQATSERRAITEKRALWFVVF